MFSDFLPIFFTMLIVVDPIGLVPLYIGLTSHIKAEQKKGIIRRAVLISFGVLLVFVFLGKHILRLLNIEPGSFYIAGGIMLFIISLEMLFGRPSHAKVSEREQPEQPSDEGASVAVFPLAIPMLAGPGTISAIIVYTGGYSGGGNADFSPLSINLMLILSLILILGIAWASLRASDYILRFLGETGVSVLERIMGLLLAGMSVQFIYDGIVRLGLIPAA
jgi:multiple antibiotic resistance protein